MIFLKQLEEQEVLDQQENKVVVCHNDKILAISLTKWKAYIHGMFFADVCVRLQFDMLESIQNDSNIAAVLRF